MKKTKKQKHLIAQNVSFGGGANVFWSVCPLTRRFCFCPNPYFFAKVRSIFAPWITYDFEKLYFYFILLYFGKHKRHIPNRLLNCY